MATSIPRVGAFDSTLRLLLDPYGFITQATRQHGSDVVETRLMLRRTICLTGPEAAQLFYDESRFRRAGAAPLPVQLTLFGRHGVQTLDDAEHRHRKALFLSVTMDPRLVQQLVDAVSAAWQEEAALWTGRDHVALYPALLRLLTREVCGWAGIPVSQHELPRRTRVLSSLFDDAAGPGPRHLRSLLARRAANRWAAGVVEDIRAGRRSEALDRPAGTVALHRDRRGELLPADTAGVELLNVLRPTVAVAVYLTLVAQALVEHPEWRSRLRAGDELDEAFVQEVRRHYPFFPTTVARTRREFTWHGHRFPAGRRVLLDLHATNHDSRAWERPDEFDPERFADRVPGPFELVPQGGGHPEVQHRCPGEQITIALMRVGVEHLARRMEWTAVEPAPLNRSRAPALPPDGFRITDVRLRD